jgi:3-methyl-2-oxobutanoate hydroxymethyltransferase
MLDDSKVTILTLRRRKIERQKVPVLTCYDCPTAALMASAGIDVLLVGDTYAEVLLGHSTTLPANMDMMIQITSAVRRGAPQAFIIGDMPYLSYQADPRQAIANAGRFMSEAGCDAVKVEVDRDLSDTVRAMSRATIPVVAHLGLKPQSVHQMGGYRGQGRTAEAAARIIEDARLMEQAGASLLLLEAVPAEITRLVAEGTELPVIGCAAGPHADATVVVLHDMLGYQAGHPPRFVKRYLNLHDELLKAFASYKSDVESGVFPAEAHSQDMPEDELSRLRQRLARR